MNIKKLLKIIIVLLFVFSFAVYSYSSMNGILFTQEEVDYSGKVLTGFNDYSTHEYIKFMNDVSEINYSTNFGKTVAVSKNLNNKYLLVGHSVVAMGYQSIKNERIDIIGLAGSQFINVLSICKNLNRRYDTVYVWCGINDIIRYTSLTYSDSSISFEEYFTNVKDCISKINNRMSPITKVVFILISPTGTLPVDLYAALLNNYIKENYNFIEIDGIYPDLDNYHFSPERFKRIFDTYIRQDLVY